MASGAPRAVPVGRPEGREAALDALEAALSSGGPAVLILEGPEGSCADELLDWVQQRAAQLGQATARWPCGAPPAGETVAPAVLCVGEAAALDPNGLRAFPASAVVVLALRTGTELRDPATFAALRARPTTHTVALGPLDTPAVRRSLERARPDFPAEEALATACWALTGGNPELVRRVVALLAACDGPQVDRLVTPLLPELAERWQGLLEGLGPECSALADSATLLADETPLWVVTEVAGLGAGASAADTLQRIGFLRSADPVCVSAPLLRRARAARTEDARGHERRRRAARLLGRTAEGLSAAADHLLALPPGGEPWAVELLGAAAARATGDGDHGRAAACLTRALDEPLDPPERVALLIRLGHAYESAGTDGGAEAYRDALLLAGPGERAGIHLLLGRALFGTADYRGSALELERGLAAAGPDETELTASCSRGPTSTASRSARSRRRSPGPTRSRSRSRC